jgi:hypothetical protein
VPSALQFGTEREDRVQVSERAERAEKDALTRHDTGIVVRVVLRRAALADADAAATARAIPSRNAPHHTSRRPNMSDDTNLRGPSDRNRINLSEDYEVRYWSQTFGVSEDRLRELVRQHGNSPQKIREALGKAA